MFAVELVVFQPVAVAVLNLIKFNCINVMQKTILKIKGMHCASCVALIEKTLKKEKGIFEVNVNIASEKANLKFNSEEISLEKIQGIILQKYP